MMPVPNQLDRPWVEKYPWLEVDLWVPGTGQRRLIRQFFLEGHERSSVPDQKYYGTSGGRKTDSVS
jgi:hypothetical protein